MKRFSFHYFPRDFEAGDLIENFLVSTVSSILVIRGFLSLTGWPKILTHQYYIEHMLFGGFIMMFTLIAMLVFLNRETKYIASVVGGIGFGTFIDELGKFITKDNNYFYQPTIAMIYVILVVIFLLARTVEKYFKLSDTEYAINALEISKNAIMHDLDTEEKKQALYLLKFTNDDISKMLEKTLKEIRAIPPGRPHIFHQIKSFFSGIYMKFISSRYFNWLIVTFFIIVSTTNFFGALFSFDDIENFADWGQLIFSVVSGFLVLTGILFLIYKRSRNTAYQLFKYAVLISIFLTQFFRFLQDQLSAITVLVLSLVVLSTLQYLIYEEGLLTKERD